MIGQRKLISSPKIYPETLFTTEVDSQSGPSLAGNYARHSAFKLQGESNHSAISTLDVPIQLVDQPAVSGTTYSSIIPGVGFAAGKVTIYAYACNRQTNSYLSTLSTEQQRLKNITNAYLRDVYSTTPNPTAKQLRQPSSDWMQAKQLVVRDELMKLQIGGKTDLPLTDIQKAELGTKLKGLDLGQMSDAKVNSIIQDILKPEPKNYLDALKAFKSSGKVESCFQVGKLDQLRDYLKTIDLSKITAKEFKYIMDNFIEKIEIHHRTSISNDATVQSDINNLDTLNTTQHDKKHTDPETGKINYRKKLSEAPLDRQAELKAMNRKRILNKEISGLGVAVAIGLGTGFALGFLVSLARNGINPDSIKFAFVAGAKQATSSAKMAVGGYVIGRTIGAAVGKSLTECVKNLVGREAGEKVMEKISEICNMAAVGALVTVAFSVYEFAKLKQAGYGTKECLLRAGKTALLSTSLLIISAIAIWAGCPGIVVSIVSGVISIGYATIRAGHDKRLLIALKYYSIELCKPDLCLA